MIALPLREVGYSRICTTRGRQCCHLRRETVNQHRRRLCREPSNPSSLQCIQTSTRPRRRLATELLLPKALPELLSYPTSPSRPLTEPMKTTPMNISQNTHTTHPTRARQLPPPFPQPCHSLSTTQRTPDPLNPRVEPRVPPIPSPTTHKRIKGVLQRTSRCGPGYYLAPRSTNGTDGRTDGCDRVTRL